MDFWDLKRKSKDEKKIEELKLFKKKKLDFGKLFTN